MSDATNDPGPEEQPTSYGPYDKERPPPLDFERWAALAASLIGSDPEQRIDRLADQDVDLALFDACDTFWSSTIAGQIGRGELGLANRFAAICAEAVERDAHQTREIDTAAAPTALGPVGDATAFLTALPDVAPLPFARDPMGGPPQRIEPADQNVEEVGGATEVISAEVVAAIGAPLPFSAPAPMDPERYAEVVVRTERMPPAVVAAIHAELDVDDRAALDAGMERHFADHPNVRTRFEAHVDRLRRERG